MRHQKFLISVLLVVGFGMRASASLVSCTTISCYNAAIAGDGAENFSNVSFTAGNLGTSFTDSPIPITFADVLGMTGTNNPSGWPSSTALTVNPGVSTLTLTLPTNVNAIDLYLGMQDFSFFTITVSDGSTPVYSNGSFTQSNVSVPAFFGITTTAAFNTFTITSQASVDKITLDDVEVGETPEVATILLVGSGLFLLWLGRRKMIGDDADSEEPGGGMIHEPIGAISE